MARDKDKKSKKVGERIGDGVRSVGDRVRDGAGRAADKVREGVEQVGERAREGAERLGQAVLHTAQRARDTLSRLLGRGRITGVYAVGTPAAARAARDFRVDDRPLLVPGSKAAVAWQRVGRTDTAAIFHDADLARTPDRLDATLEMASGLAEDLVDGESLAEQAREWLRGSGAYLRDFEVEPGGAPPDEEQAGADHGLASIPDDEPVFARMRHLLPAEIELAQSVYGDSLDFDRIYLGAAVGAFGAPFTPSWPGLRFRNAPKPFGPGMWGSVICMGSRVYREGIPSDGSTPARFEARHVFIHEMAHAWQSQHHLNPSKYMWNALGSMLRSVALVVTGTALAYCYRPGKAFHSYGAEQLASQAQMWFLSNRTRADLAAIVAHMQRVKPGRVDPALVVAFLRTHISAPLPGIECPPGILSREDSMIRD